MQEHSGPPMPPPTGRNWKTFVEKSVPHGPNEVEIKTLQAGDQLVVVTRNTRYEFDWLEGGTVLLRTDRTDRPWGQVTLSGCAFRRTDVVAEGVVFKGGKLQFLSMEGQVKHQTTVITDLTVIRQGRKGTPEKSELTGTNP